MKMIKTMGLAALFGAMQYAPAAAQHPGAQPAEFPPASFTGQQYVDSKGCVFIRVGADGRYWVPRLTRSRKVVCGYKPSLNAQSRTTIASRSQPVPSSVMINIDAGTQPRPVTNQHVALNSRSNGAITETTRILPKHVALDRVRTPRFRVPHGYKQAWTDGRLNPRRAEQNLRGRAKMLLVWTQTVPRRLIDKRTGQDVTNSVPLVYPYLDIASQHRNLGEVRIVNRNGTVVKQVVRQPIYSSRSAKAAIGSEQFVHVGYFASLADAQAIAKRVSGLGLPPQIAKFQQNGKTYMRVQAGPFANGQSANKAIVALRGAGYKNATLRN